MRGGVEARHRADSRAIRSPGDEPRNGRWTRAACARRAGARL